MQKNPRINYKLERSHSLSSAHAWKACKASKPSRVRIPLSPHNKYTLFKTGCICYSESGKRDEIQGIDLIIVSFNIIAFYGIV